MNLRFVGKVELEPADFPLSGIEVNDEDQFTSWVKQASLLPGWAP